MDVNIGSLNKRVNLQYPTKVSDGMGGFSVTWVPLVQDTWAAIWPVSANEVIEANSTSMVVTHRIRIRHRSALDASWRIKFGDKYYAIISVVNPNMANKYLDIMAKEKAS
jgi:SPP1 family predicted phage head-tail adaptor